MVWDRCTLRLNINMLAIPDATTQRTSLPDQVNINRWRSVGLCCSLEQAKPCSCRVAVFLFNSPFLRIYIPFRMCHLFFPSNCWWFQFLDLKCCWLLLTQWSLLFLLFLQPYLAWSNSLHALSLTKRWLQHNINFSFAKIGLWSCSIPSYLWKS